MTNDKAGTGYWSAGAIASTRRDRSLTNFEALCLFSALGLILSFVFLMLSGSPEIFNALTLVAN
jgi:hypothetical protein